MLKNFLLEYFFSRPSFLVVLLLYNLGVRYMNRELDETTKQQHLDMSQRVTLLALHYQGLDAVTSLRREQTSYLLSGEPIRWLAHLGLAARQETYLSLDRRFLHDPAAADAVVRALKNAHSDARYTWRPLYFLTLYSHAVLVLLSAIDWTLGTPLTPLTWLHDVLFMPRFRFASSFDCLAQLPFIWLFLQTALTNAYVFSRLTYSTHAILFLGCLYPIVLAWIREGSFFELILGSTEMLGLAIGNVRFNDLLLPRVKLEKFSYLIAHGYPDLFATSGSGAGEAEAGLGAGAGVGVGTTAGTGMVRLAGRATDEAVAAKAVGMASQSLGDLQAGQYDQLRLSRQAIHSSSLFLNEITGKTPSFLDYINFLWERFKDLRYLFILATVLGRVSGYLKLRPGFWVLHAVLLSISLFHLFQLYYRTNCLAFFIRFVSRLKADLALYLKSIFQ